MGIHPNSNYLILLFCSVPCYIIALVGIKTTPSLILHVKTDRPSPLQKCPVHIIVIKVISYFFSSRLLQTTTGTCPSTLPTWNSAQIAPLPTYNKPVPPCHDPSNLCYLCLPNCKNLASPQTRRKIIKSIQPDMSVFFLGSEKNFANAPSLLAAMVKKKLRRTFVLYAPCVRRMLFFTTEMVCWECERRPFSCTVCGMFLEVYLPLLLRSMELPRVWLRYYAMCPVCS